MDISRQAEDVAMLRQFLGSKKPEETERDAVVRYYMELGASAGVTAAKVVGVHVDGAEVGTVDCALADPASIAVAYAEDKLGAMLGLWTLAEFAPKTAILALDTPAPALVSDIITITRRSRLLGRSPIRFVLLDIKGARREIIQRQEIHQQRRKMIKGQRQPYKKQD